MAFLVGSTAPGLQRLAVPFVCILVAVLGYGSQWLFATSEDLEPGPLTPTESWVFNSLLACLWWTYWRTCTVDPGRYEFPRSVSSNAEGKAVVKKNREKEDGALAHSSQDEGDSDADEAGGRAPGVLATAAARRRWCRKCAAPKPPRAHHCKTCRRCIPKMDHHCPWTGNCVSLQTFPHFMRFLIYTNISLWTLLYHLYQRFNGLWTSRNLPAYLGPSATDIGLLTALTFTTGLTSLALGILFATTVKGWLFNTTMIEGWEIERHEAVLQRGGYEEEDWWRTDGDAAPRSMVDPVEFPYDISLFANMAQAMGSTNPLVWFLPFAGGPRVARLPADTTAEDLQTKLSADASLLGAGWYYEENGLNDREGMWPPIDPEKVRNARLWRQRRREELRYQEEQKAGLRNPALPAMHLSPEEEKEAFRRRQEQDLLRWRGSRMRDTSYDGRGNNIIVDEGKAGWVNADGEQLGDYGVDEDAEFDDGFVYERRGRRRDVGVPPRSVDYDDEEVPLAELRRRRKLRSQDGSGMDS